MATGATSWNTCNVYGTWHNQDGTNMEGSYTVAIPARVCNATDDVIIPAGVFATGPLVTTLGQKSFDLDLPANDDPDNTPVNWGKVKIQITFKGSANAETYVIDTPVDGSVNLRTVVLPSTAPTQAPFLVLGVAGGAARLSADGTNVLNAAGDPISTGGSGVTSYNDLTDKPALKDVAITGSYNDLLNRPTIPSSPDLSPYAKISDIPAAQVQPDWSASTGLASIKNKPTLFSGAYADLTGQPTLGTAAAKATTDFATAAQGTKADAAVPNTRTVNGKPLSGDVTLAASDVGALTPATADGRYATTAQGSKADTAVQPGVLSTVATTGSYTDLSNQPTIPSTAADVSALPNALGATATANVVVVAHGATAPTGLPDGTVIVELSA